MDFWGHPIYAIPVIRAGVVSKIERISRGDGGEARGGVVGRNADFYDRGIEKEGGGWEGGRS